MGRSVDQRAVNVGEEPEQVHTQSTGEWRSWLADHHTDARARGSSRGSTTRQAARDVRRVGPRGARTVGWTASRPSSPTTAPWSGSPRGGRRAPGRVRTRRVPHACGPRVRSPRPGSGRSTSSGQTGAWSRLDDVEDLVVPLRPRRGLRGAPRRRRALRDVPEVGAPQHSRVARAGQATRDPGAGSRRPPTAPPEANERTGGGETAQRQP